MLLLPPGWFCDDLDHTPSLPGEAWSLMYGPHSFPGMKCISEEMCTSSESLDARTRVLCLGVGVSGHPLIEGCSGNDCCPRCRAECRTHGQKDHQALRQESTSQPAPNAGSGTKVTVSIGQSSWVTSSFQGDRVIHPEPVVELLL